MHTNYNQVLISIGICKSAAEPTTEPNATEPNVPTEPNATTSNATENGFGRNDYPIMMSLAGLLIFFLYLHCN